MKVNIWTDGSFYEPFRKSSISYVIKDSSGNTLDAKVEKVTFSSVFGSTHVELIAIEHAMKRIIELGIKDPYFYCDEENLINWINGKFDYGGLYKPTVLYHLKQINRFMDELGISSNRFFLIKSDENIADKLWRKMKPKRESLVIPKAVMSLKVHDFAFENFKKTDVSIAQKNIKETLSYYATIIEKQTVFRVRLKNAKDGYGSTRLFIAGEYVFLLKGDYIFRVFKEETNFEILENMNFNATRKKKISDALLTYRKKRSYIR